MYLIKELNERNLISINNLSSKFPKKRKLQEFLKMLSEDSVYMDKLI